MPQVRFEFVGDTSDLDNSLKKVQRSLGSVDDKADAAAKSLKKVGSSSKASGSSLKGFEKIAQGVGGKVGEATGTLTAFGEGFAELSVALGPVGAGLTAAAVAVAGLGVAAIGAAAGAVALVSAADDLMEATAAFDEVTKFEGITPEATESIKMANNALDAISVVAKQVGVTLAGELAPYVEDGALLFLELALRGRDLFNSFANGTDAVRTFAVQGLSELLKILTGPLVPAFEALLRGIESIATVGANLGVPGMEALAKAAKDGADAIDGAFDGAAESIIEYGESWAPTSLAFKDFTAGARLVAAGVGEVSEAQDKGTTSTRENTEANEEAAEAERKRVEELRKREEALAAAAAAESAALEITKANNSDLLSEKDSLIQAYQEEMDQLDELEAKAGGNAEALNAIEKARVANAKRLERDLTKLSDEEAKKRAQNAKESALAVGQSAVDLAQAITDAAEAGGAAQKDIAIANKAIAIAQATINTAMAISQALASAPPPVSFVLAGLAAAAGAATVATIAATPIKHMGGVIAPDEANIRAQKGEGILTRQTVNRIGPEGVSQLNAGGNLGTNITVVEMGHQVIGKSLRRAQKRDGNPLRDLARKTRGR